MKILVIDIGGTHVKLGLGGSRRRTKIPSDPGLTPARMVAAVMKATAQWSYAAVSIGYPGPVRNGKPAAEPKNLGRGWTRFDFAKALSVPVRVVNDAAMQAMGSYRGGKMLFMGLGTGLGTAMVAPGVLEPLELAHLPYRKGRTYEDYLGLRGLRRMGRKRWRAHVTRVVSLFRQALQVDYVMLGGGNANKLGRLPRSVQRTGNAAAIAGGIRLWKHQPPNAR
jgi:hypothetical protein